MMKIEEVIIEIQDELKKQHNMDFKNYLNSIHNSTISLNEKLQARIDKEDNDTERNFEEKNKEYLIHTVTEIVNNIFQAKAKDGSLLNTTTVGDQTGIEGRDGKDGIGGAGSANYIKDMQILNKKIRGIEDQIKTLSDKLDNQILTADEVGGQGDSEKNNIKNIKQGGNEATEKAVSNVGGVTDAATTEQIQKLLVSNYNFKTIIIEKS